MAPVILAAPAPVELPKRRRFVAIHRADRNFFLIFLLICWIGVVMGFAPAVTLRWNGHARFVAPLILKIHAVAFCTWLLLLTAQILLVRYKRAGVHMKLGIAAFGLVPVMVVSGYFLRFTRSAGTSLIHQITFPSSSCRFFGCCHSDRSQRQH